MTYMERQSPHPPKRPPPGPSTTEHEDRPTWETLYRKQAAWVFARLRHLRVAEAWCPDAMHDVFLIVHERLAEYEPRQRLTGWLGAIAKNVAAKYRDREGRMKSIDADPDLDGLRDLTHDPEAATGAVEDQRFVQRVLDELDVELIHVLLQHHVDEVPIEEIARHLDLPEGTVKTRLARARKAFKAAWTRLQARDRHETKPHGAMVVPLFGSLSLLEAARQIPPLPPGVYEQVWARLDRDLGGGGGGDGRPPGPGIGPAAGPPPTVVSTSAARLAAAKLVAALLLAAGGGVLGGALWSPLQRAPSNTRAAPPELVAAPPLTVGSVALTATAAAPSAAPSARAAASSAGSAPAASDTEKTLMNKAAGALAAGKLGDALLAVQQHARDFPAGARAQQRETLWIAILLREGLADEARERFAQFERAYPRSPRLAELRAAVTPP
jgi:RNA polymerase sigma-70 factor (ECF subfamily)